MDFKELFTNEFWSKRELSYQHVHLWWSMSLSFIVAYFVQSKWFLLTGLVAGLIMELYQMWGNSISYLDRKGLDVLRDLFFWTIGSGYVYLTLRAFGVNI